MKPGNVETSKGLKHVVEATCYTCAGLKAAFAETAFRLELGFCTIAVVLAWTLHFTLIWSILLTVGGLGLLCVELLNTAIEAVVDLASPEYHVLAKRSKDLGSAAVGIYVVAYLILWTGALCTL